MELQTCRPVGMGGPGRIPWTAIHEYAVAKDVVDQERFEVLMREMDAAYVTSYYDRLDANDG